MASKHAKLKLALTRAIIDFFLQEDLYADELKIQGTLCVTADRSAIFVTQITETVSEASDGRAVFPPNDGPRADVQTGRAYSVPHPFNCESPEDLTCKSGSRAGRQPPAAHTKNHDALRYKSSVSCLTSPTPSASTHKSEPWPLPVNKLSNDVSDRPQVSRPGVFGTGLNTPGLSLLDNTDGRSDTLFSLNSAILNAAAKSAIERLTSLSRENDQKATGSVSNTWGQNALDGPATDGHQQSEILPLTPASTDHNLLHTEVIDCSSAKKRKLEKPCATATDTNNDTHSVMVMDSIVNIVVPTHNNDLDILQPHTPDEPLMLVTPKRERLSEDEAEPDQIGDGGSNGKMTKASVSGDSSPRDGTKLHSPPSSAIQQVSGSGCLSSWSFTTQALKEEPSSLAVTDWTSVDWMRKPRTKFSQEQLQALETEYKNDPFLSTSADKRADLARRLNITEKNVQIWFQNQRRRRRAAAYSQMHYTLNDTQGPDEGGKNFTANNIDATDGTLGSPDFNSDHDGDSSRNCTLIEGENNLVIDGKDMQGSQKDSLGVGLLGRTSPGRVSYAASLEDSNSSDLVIAIDPSSKQDDEVEENEGHSEGHSEGQAEGQAEGQSKGNTKGQSETDSECSKPKGQLKGQAKGQAKGIHLDGQSKGQSKGKATPSPKNKRGDSDKGTDGDSAPRADGTDSAESKEVSDSES